MLYLEDYLEMIEHLPQELRDRFTEMRELDLAVQNNMDELEKRVKAFFNDCRRYPPDNLAPSVKSEFDTIGKEYKKTLEDAEEKVHLSNQMYELVDKYLRRLDTELHKFKCELEADNKGITEVLEKRSLELDTPVNSNITSQQKENRYDSNNFSGGSSSRYSSSRPRSEKRRESSANSLGGTSYGEKRQAIVPVPLVETRHSLPQPQIIQNSNSNTSSSNSAVGGYSLGHIGAGPAIAAAASQAIAATQQMQQGRRTASLKASYEAINTGSHGHEFGIGRELAGAAQTAIQAIQQDHANNKKNKKKWSASNSSSSSASSAVHAMLNAPLASSTVTTSVDSPAIDVSSQSVEVTDGEWTYDPDEPKYCLCNQVSYGDMVACDNEECPTEWFHYPCVGITAPPKGKWYCPSCAAAMKRIRGSRKN